VLGNYIFNFFTYSCYCNAHIISYTFATDGDFYQRHSTHSRERNREKIYFHSVIFLSKQNKSHIVTGYRTSFHFRSSDFPPAIVCIGSIRARYYFYIYYYYFFFDAIIVCYLKANANKPSVYKFIFNVCGVLRHRVFFRLPETRKTVHKFQHRYVAIIIFE